LGVEFTPVGEPIEFRNRTAKRASPGAAFRKSAFLVGPASN